MPESTHAMSRSKCRTGMVEYIARGNTATRRERSMACGHGISAIIVQPLQVEE